MGRQFPTKFNLAHFPPTGELLYFPSPYVRLIFWSYNIDDDDDE